MSPPTLISAQVQKELDRFQRLITNVGFTVDMKILHDFWTQSQQSKAIPGKDPIKPCVCFLFPEITQNPKPKNVHKLQSFICFHCCVNKDNRTEITKCKKSCTQKLRFRCDHICSSSCNGKTNRFQKKGGLTARCNLWKSEQPLDGKADHPSASFCGFMYDPMV